MFQDDQDVIADSVSHQISTLKKSYVLKKDDYISLKVLTNNGEQLIDPTGQLKQSIDGVSKNDQVEYLIRQDGTVRLPLIGSIELEGLTLEEATLALEEKFNTFYSETFCLVKVTNKRVFVLGAARGAAGGINVAGNVQGLVVDLENENMNLIEVLALSGGVDRLSKVNKIRIIRGDLSNPNVYVVDLSTIEGMRKSDLQIQPNDIIYIEQYNKVVSQTISEITPVLGFIGSIANFIILVLLINNR